MSECETPGLVVVLCEVRQVVRSCFALSRVRVGNEEVVASDARALRLTCASWCFLSTLGQGDSMVCGAQKPIRWK